MLPYVCPNKLFWGCPNKLYFGVPNILGYSSLFFFGETWAAFFFVLPDSKRPSILEFAPAVFPKRLVEPAVFPKRLVEPAVFPERFVESFALPNMLSCCCAILLPPKMLPPLFPRIL